MAHSDPKHFAALVLPPLLREEAMNCVALSVLDTLMTDPLRYPTSHLLTIEASTRIEGMAWQTPPHPLGLSVMPRPAARALALHVASTWSVRPSRIAGPRPGVDEFRDAWVEGGIRVRKMLEQRIHRLDRVKPGVRASGVMRTATEADEALLLTWSLAFVVDCGLDDDAEVVKQSVSAAIRQGNRVLWEVAGEPVSMAGFGGKTPTGIRVNWVYTPPEQRGHGFASALVAALSEDLLARGRRSCFLYTDARNATSNHIYREIGYEPVGDAAYYSFG